MSRTLPGQGDVLLRLGAVPLLLALWMTAAPASGQMPLEAAGAPLTIDFAGFAGAGLAPAPVAGQLDSEVFSVTGFSEGDLPFGATAESGDFARGTTTGGVSSGGLYAFDLGDGATALGVQPTGSDFTPGSLVLHLRNDTGAPIDRLFLAYDVVVFNDQGRGSRWDLSYAATELGPFESVEEGLFVSPQAEDTSPEYVLTPMTVEVSSLALLAGESLYLRWASDDDGGSGSRDEIGMTNVSIVAEGELPAPGAIFDDGFETGETSRWTETLTGDPEP